MSPTDKSTGAPPPYPGPVGVSDALFGGSLAVLAGAYVLLVALLLAADFSYTSWADLRDAFSRPEIRYALVLSLATATLSTVLSVWFATPIGYLMSRHAPSRAAGSPRWRRLAYTVVDTLLDMPIVLPPLVVGMSLLILFKFSPFVWVSEWVVYEAPAIVLAQFVVSCALAARTMRATFAQISDRQEKVAMTLGASRSAAFWTVLLPQARVGLLTAATLSWSHALGQFGPILVFASATRFRTEVLPTSIYLEMQAGDLGAALAVSLMLIGLAIGGLVVARLLGRVAPVT